MAGFLHPRARAVYFLDGHGLDGVVEDEDAPVLVRLSAGITKKPDVGWR